MVKFMTSKQDMQVDVVDITNENIEQRNNSKNSTKKFVIKDVVDFSTNNGGLPIYACDKISKTVGAKIFYSSSYNEFYLFYSKLPSKDRCFYETLLPEQPCHLYLDMEQDNILNNDKMNEVIDIGNELLDELVNFIIEFGKDAFQKSGLEIKKKDIRIIELDSGTSKKFSKHYIIKIMNGNIMFLNNFHCGSLMRRFQKYIIQLYGHPDENNRFFHNHTSDRTGDTAKNFLIDMGVYTLRRQFRLLGSAKRTNDPKNRRELWIKGNENKMTIEFFLDCLVQYINNAGTLFTIKVCEINGSDPLSSSLRSFDKDGNPISIAQNSTGIRHAIGDDKQNSMNLWAPRYSKNTGQQTTKKQKIAEKDETMLPLSLQQELKKYYLRKYGYNISGYIIGRNKVKLETNDKRCMNKLKSTGEAEHKFNHVYFILYPESFITIQGCYDDTYCSKNGTKSFTKLGKIEDENVQREINQWISQHKYQKWYNTLDVVSESWTPTTVIPTPILTTVNTQAEINTDDVPINRIKNKTKII